MTPNFKLSEFVKSSVAEKKGIDNTPPEAILKNLQFTAECMETVKEVLQRKHDENRKKSHPNEPQDKLSVRITSAYRCEELNKEIGGSKTSQHPKGEAVDFICPKFGTPKQIALELSKHTRECKIDQLICEGGWVHASFTQRPRYEVLTCVGPKKFVKGIV